jgi:uncharacterized cupredoxin-like copper-binding protein
LRIRTTTAALVLAVALTACGGAAAPEPTAEVILTEMAIAAPLQMEAGTAVWEVSNTGQTHHNLTVCEGEAGRCSEEPVLQRVLVKDETARDPEDLPDETDALVLGAGWTNIVELDLTPGTWRLWCAVPNHVPNGMELVVDVS